MEGGGPVTLHGCIYVTDRRSSPRSLSQSPRGLFGRAHGWGRLRYEKRSLRRARIPTMLATPDYHERYSSEETLGLFLQSCDNGLVEPVSYTHLTLPTSDLV